MRSFLLLLVVLVAGCYSAPGTIGAGFNVGGRSQLDLSAGGMGQIDRDGVAFTGEGSGLFGGKWTGRGFGGGYVKVNDHYFGGRAAGKTDLGGYLKPSFNGAGGINSKGSMPFGFLPGLGIEKIASVGGNGEMSYGDDARRLAALYGDFGATNY